MDDTFDTIGVFSNNLVSGSAADTAESNYDGIDLFCQSITCNIPKPDITNYNESMDCSIDYIECARAQDNESSEPEVMVGCAMMVYGFSDVTGKLVQKCYIEWDQSHDSTRSTAISSGIFDVYDPSPNTDNSLWCEFYLSDASGGDLNIKCTDITQRGKSSDMAISEISPAVSKCPTLEILDELLMFKTYYISMILNNVEDPQNISLKLTDCTGGDASRYVTVLDSNGTEHGKHTKEIQFNIRTPDRWNYIKYRSFCFSLYHEKLNMRIASSVYFRLVGHRAINSIIPKFR